VTATADDLTRLARWFARQCDGDWEHQGGVSIKSTDNPGWWIKIDLKRTELDGRPFSEVAEAIDDNGFPAAPRWLRCYLQDGLWHGAGDETRLSEIIS